MSFLYSGSLWSSLYCGVSSLCVGLYMWLVKVSWLGKLVSMFWWMELYFFSLECNEMSSDEETVFSFNPLERLPIACPLPLEQPPCAFAPTAPSVPSPQTVAPLLKGEAWVLLL